MAWTDQMVEDLKRMWDEGLTTGEIGKRLGVSKNSIVGKVHRLQLSGRPSPIKKKDAPTAETPAPAKPSKAEKTSSQPNKPKEEKVSAPKEEEIVVEISAPVSAPAPKAASKPSGKTMLTDLDNHTCRWPIGDPKDENFHFCGRKVKIGQTYCEEHANIAYVKPGKK